MAEIDSAPSPNVVSRDKKSASVRWAQHVVRVWPPCCDVSDEPTWPNDHNITQHPQMLHEEFDDFQSNLSQQHPTCRNKVAKCAQHAARNNVAICGVEMSGRLPGA